MIYPNAEGPTDDVTIARAIHVLAVVHWIGGVGMVTAVILPAMRRGVAPAERLAAFEAIERRFARQARVSVTLAGLAGFYMTHRLDAWDWSLDAGYWWMHAIVGDIHRGAVREAMAHPPNGQLPAGITPCKINI